MVEQSDDFVARSDPSLMLSGRCTRRFLLSRAARLSVAGGGLLALASAGCGSSDSDTDGGSMTGVLTLMTYPGWIGPHEVSDFEDLHPDVKIKQINGQAEGPAAQTMLMVQNPGTYDISLSALDVVGRMEEADILGDWSPTDTPNVKYVDQTWRDNFPYGVPTDAGAIGIAYRKDIVKEGIESWSDFWHLADKYSGMVVFNGQEVNAFTIALKYLGYDINTDDEAEIKEARDALIEIKPHVLAFVTTDQAKRLYGDNPSAAMATVFNFEGDTAVREDPRIAYTAPSEGMPGYLEGWVPVAGSEHRALAMEFMNFHMEPKNYASFAKATGNASLQSAARKYLPSYLSSSPILNMPPDVLSKMEFQRYPGAETIELITRYFQEVKSS